tara:strand:+ start:2588 stop:2818 length:231 start_codon:yes stop_codon:yes gene_type:complete
MDKQTRDYIKTQRLIDQIDMLVHTAFAIMFSVVFTSAIILNILSNVKIHTISGVAMILSILIVGNALGLRDKTIIV